MKRTTLLLLVAASLAARAADDPATSLITWAGPGGSVTPSPDYEVTVTGSKSAKLFTYYTYNHPYDKTLDSEGQYVKLSFLALHSNQFRLPRDNADTYAHSWAYFDFAGGPVEVEVKILKPGDGLTLPLKNCAVLPTVAHIDCRVASAGTMRFTLTRPAKIAVVPNQREAADALKGLPAKRTLEGYRNPLFLFARAPETDVPAKTGQGTLVVAPGRSYSADDLAKAGTIYFEPGVHDFSRIDGDPDHYIVLHKGQTMYLAGGAFLYAQIKSDVTGPISAMPLVRGRGTLSGDKHRWTDLPYKYTVVRNVRLDGIHVTDSHNHLTHSIAPIRDIAVVGAWHGNTDGLTFEVPKSDPYAGWHIDDCFVMAADTNLKVGGCARTRNYTIWQLNNAEPIWIRGADGAVVDGVNVIAYNKWGQGQVVNFRAAEKNQKNLVVRNISVEAPFSAMLFFMPSEYKGPGEAFENVLFENITVNTPHIYSKSTFGPAGANLGRVVFRNLVVNGVKVTAENCRDYFELPAGVAAGKELAFE